MKLVLQREITTEDGTFGSIIVGGQKFITLELPWKFNLKNVSSIPAGTYKCNYTWSSRFNRRHYLVDGVEDRAGIRIHPANLARQLNGCIALGMSAGEIKGVKAIMNSRMAVGLFETILEMKPFELTIIDNGVPIDVG
jgi:hypothetical protein